MKNTDPRFLIARREAILSVALTVAYVACWAATAYGTNVTSVGITGFPLWFELSCVAVPALFVALCALLVRAFFVEVPLEDNLATVTQTKEGKNHAR